MTGDVQVCIRCEQPRPLQDFKRTGFGRKKTCDGCVKAKRAATNATRAQTPEDIESRRWASVPGEPGITGKPRPVRLPDGWITTTPKARTS